MFEKNTLYSPQLGRSVKLHIFVPDDCCVATPCPVLYLNDGELYYGKSSCANEPDGICFGEYYQTYHEYLPRVLIVGIEPHRNGGQELRSWFHIQRRLIHMVSILLRSFTERAGNCLNGSYTISSRLLIRHMQRSRINSIRQLADFPPER